MESDEYCRAIEAYLCRANEGNLVRVSGPAFEKVREWAAMGVPIKVAYQGIDRHLQRAATKGPRRRPVRIEFCEADILDAFDAWRRAVGVRSSAESEGDEPDSDESAATAGRRRRQSLSTHIDRVIVRLTALRTGPALSSAWESTLDQIVRQLDSLHARSRSAKGADREAILTELGVLDGQLGDAAWAALESAAADLIAREADEELAPFRGRMAADAYDVARRRCADRIVRVRLALPVLTSD
jgi:hypothetical protein